MSEEPDDCRVGYTRPPTAHQFKPGYSGNKSGRPKRKPGAIDLDDLLDQPVRVTQAGKRQGMEPRKVALLAQIKKAQQGDLRALAHVLDKLVKHGVLGSDRVKRIGGVITLPSDMPFAMAQLMAERFGVPPWSSAQRTKGKADYLARRSDDDARLDDAMGYFHHD